MTKDEIKERLHKDLTGRQWGAMKSAKRRVLVVARAGLGKTEVMARSVAWWWRLTRHPRTGLWHLPSAA